MYDTTSYLKKVLNDSTWDYFFKMFKLSKSFTFNKILYYEKTSYKDF